MIGVAPDPLAPDRVRALLGVAIGAFVPVLVGWFALRHDRAARRALDEQHAAGRVIRETFHNSHALLAFFALSNVDILVARNVLDAHQAGLYAGGLILAKAVLFLPQFVVVLAFPSMSTAVERAARPDPEPGAGRRCSAWRAPLGAWLLSGLALIFVGGERVRGHRGPAVGVRRPRHAALDAAAAGLHVLARQGQRSVYLVWVALVVLVGAGLTWSSTRRPC